MRLRPVQRIDGRDRTTRTPHGYAWSVDARAITRRADTATRWPRSAAGRYARLPSLVLSGFLLIASASAALFSLVPTIAAELHSLGVFAALFFLAMSLWVWFFGDRFRDGNGLDFALVVTSMAAVGSAAFAQAPDTQVMLGLNIMLFSVYAAYFRPIRRFVVELLLMLITYAVVVLVVTPLLHLAFYVVIAIVSTTVSGTVAALVAQLRTQTVTDGLTGVLNRRGLRAMGDFVTADMRRTGVPATVALVDLDNFKAYNDRRGHLAGDELLVSTARDLKSGLRATDVVARFGGDEFALIMPGVPAARAREALRRLAQGGGSTTWTAGVTDWSASETLETALSRADQDLYRSKQSR